MFSFCAALLGGKYWLQAGGAHFFAEEGEDMSEEERQRMEKQSRDAKKGYVDVKVKYTLKADGSIQTVWDIDTSNSLPAILPPPLYK